MKIANCEFPIPGQTIRQHEDGVVGAHIAIDGDTVETIGDGFPQRGLKRLRFDCGIGGDEAEHGGVKTLRPGGRTREKDRAPFDAWLREEGHARNPGTIADLIAAALFVGLRTGLLSPLSCR